MIFYQFVEKDNAIPKKGLGGIELGKKWQFTKKKTMQWLTHSQGKENIDLKKNLSYWYILVDKLIFVLFKRIKNTIYCVISSVWHIINLLKRTMQYLKKV